MQRHTAASLTLAALSALTITACEKAGEEGATKKSNGLQGAWSVVAMRISGPDSASNRTIQPSLYIFVDKHYSMMRVTGNQPRGLAAKDSSTDAEKLAAFDSFVANTGTYEIADSTITIHPIVARSPNFMAGGSDKYHFRVSGDTLWLSNSDTDFRRMMGGQVGPTPPGPVSPSVLTLVRQK